ncbi:MAG: hypothetical protein BAJALOKI2v1_50028 [Promethearchaeota archaeon]|nr:MAG: hypothetical protein BAJALOKI2v1_50028 [Candidatus Lokiarchaeota archaeon]
MHVYKTISFQELFSPSTDHFLRSFYKIGNSNISDGMDLHFELIEKTRTKKKSPILQLATPDDAQEIVDIYLDIYQGTYPYKEMEDIKEVRRMIESSGYRWLLFKIANSDKIAGCFTYQLDFEKKHGYMRGFNVKREFHGILDSIKAVIGSMIGVWTEYKNQIKLWYCENRTAHTKSQYLSNVCGIKPIAFLPKKDRFNGRIESDIMHIAYEFDTLSDLRSLNIPRFIPEVESFFQYSNNRYNLGQYKIDDPQSALNLKNLGGIERDIHVKIEEHKFGYKTIRFSLQHKGSFFTFLYNPHVQNFEKTEYKVSNNEELFLFLWKWLELIESFHVRYAECLVSAYRPEDQKLFKKIGFSPRGYLPSWHYNKRSNTFEDYVMFNWCKGPIYNTPNLLESGEALFKLTRF